MNLAIRSMYGDLGNYAADTFIEDLHKDLKADFILANPPFNNEWDRDKVEDDPRWNQLESAVGIYFRRGKAGISRLFS